MLSDHWISVSSRNAYHKYFLSFFILLFGVNAFSQYASGKTLPDPAMEKVKDFNDPSFRYATTISVHDLREHLQELSSDEYEGRETGAQGNLKAANYLADKFTGLGLQSSEEDGSFFQKVAFTFSSIDKSNLTIGNGKYKNLKDYILFPHKSADLSINNEEIVFLGYAIDDEKYSDYEGHNLDGKVVIAFEGEPTDDEGLSLITESRNLSKWSSDWTTKSEAAKKHGVRTLILIANDLKGLINDNRRALVNRVVELGDRSKDVQLGVNTVFLSARIAEELLGDKRNEIIDRRDALKNGRSVDFYSSIDQKVSIETKIRRETIQSNNVAGLIPGTEHKDEVIVVSAHFDHVGKKGKEVYNGADDNASGTSTVLEIAEAFATSAKLGKQPKRSILFLLVTGEEKGLLGSQYYAGNPYFPLDKTMANVNIDMVGRWGDEYPVGGQDYIYVIGSDRLSQELHDINEDVNKTYSHLQLDYKYNDEKDPNRFYYRSDHYNFAKHGIPSIFFFNGVHQDYHRISDTIEKIDFSLLEKRARHIFHLVWKLANKEKFLEMNDSLNSVP